MDRVFANRKVKVTGRCEGTATYPECLPLKKKPPLVTLAGTAQYPWVLHSTRGYCGSPGTVGTADGYCRVLWVLHGLK